MTTITMEKRKHTVYSDEIKKLAVADFVAGEKQSDICRRYGIDRGTFSCWKKGVIPNEMKTFEEMSDERIFDMIEAHLIHSLESYQKIIEMVINDPVGLSKQKGADVAAILAQLDAKSVRILRAREVARSQAEDEEEV